MGLFFFLVNTLIYSSGAFILYKCLCYKGEDFEQPMLIENTNYESIENYISEESSDEELPKYEDINNIPPPYE